MATSGESSVDPVKEETPKETPEPSTAEGEQQKDAGKEEVTPKATSEAETAGGDTQQKEEASESRPKSASPEPELVLEHVRIIQAGSEMMKVKGSKQYHRTFWLDEELTSVLWNSANKKPFKARILLSSIREVRKGTNTEGFKSSGKTFEDDKCFSIIYGSDFKTLDLVCQNAEEATIWINGIKALKHHTDTGARQSQARDRYIKGLFEAADKNNDGTLDFSEIIKLMKQLNVGLSKRVLKKKFKEVDDDLNGTLSFDEFSKLFRELATRPELWRLFIKHISQPDFMSAADLQTFLEVEQRSEPILLKDCEELIELYECSEEGKSFKLLSFDGFRAFMLGKENDIFNFNHKAIYQDMTQPMSHYYIHSSHNTYLLGDQLRSESSVEAYIRTLRAGCRCVELDCWDGDNDEPIIYHGHTLTSKILFKDVITAIKDHAFATSPYPVILSIENHCSIKQQNIMADHMSSILGDMLYVAPVDESRDMLPSPEELIHKILVKGKKLPKELEEKEDDDIDGGDVSDEDEAGDIDPHDIEVAREKVETGEPADTAKSPGPGQTLASPQQQSGGIFRRTFSFRRRERQDSSSVASPAKEKEQQTPQKKIKLGCNLSKTVNYVQSVSFKGFSHSISSGKCFQMSSFGEPHAFKYRNNNGVDFVQYNKRQLSRIYPAGKRIDSSNYDPVEMWNVGCQIVALNMQTPGSKMDYNLGKFQQNGSCGYLLKPNIMRSEVSLFDPSSREPVPGVVPKTFTIKVISGQHLPKPLKGSATGEIIDPYVRIELKGLPCDSKDFKTKYVSDNGFNPMWNETITFTAQFPELCLLRFVVYDSDTLSDDFIGQYTLPLESVEKGYRHVHLHTPTWEKIEHATIFMHITIHEAHHFNIKKLISSKATIEKARRGRKYPEPRLINIPDVDKTFRGSIYLMRESHDLKEDYNFYLLKFKGLVDAKAEASLRECVWLMGFKAKNAKIEILLKKKGKIFEVEAKTAHVTSSIVNIFNTFNELNSITVPILDRADDIHSQLTQIFEQAFKKRRDIPVVLSQYGMNTKKIAKGIESYSYTMQLIQSELVHISKLKEMAMKNLDEILDAAARVNLQIIEEKVPTIEEAKSLEIIVDVSKTEGDGEKKAEEPSAEVKKAEELSTEAKKSNEPVAEVVAKVESEVVESAVPLEEEPKVAEAPVKSDEDVKVVEENKQVVTVEVNTEKEQDKIEDQQLKETPAETADNKEAEPTESITVEINVGEPEKEKDESEDHPQPVEAQEPKEDKQQGETHTTSDEPAADVTKDSATDADQPKEEPVDKEADASPGITLTVNMDEQHPEVTVEVESKVEVEPTVDKEKSSSPAPAADKQAESTQDEAGDQQPDPSQEDKQPEPSPAVEDDKPPEPSQSDEVKRPESTHSDASSASSSPSSPSSKHEDTPDVEEKDPSPPDDGDSGED